MLVDTWRSGGRALQLADGGRQRRQKTSQIGRRTFSEETGGQNINAFKKPMSHEGVDMDLRYDRNLEAQLRKSMAPELRYHSLKS